MHHFGSMEGLRSACDAYVAGRIRGLKENAASAGPNLDVLGLLRESEAGHLLAYLAKILTEDSPAVAQLVNGLVADAEGYLRQFEEAGMVRPSENPRARAVLLVIWSLGALTMHKHLERLLGVDLIDPDLTAKPDFARYALPVYEVYGGGVMTEDFTAKAQAAFADALEGESA